MIVVLTMFVCLGAGYAYYREGLFTAFVMFCNVFLASLVACNFWEPLAGLLEPVLAGSFLGGYEDFFCMVGLFAFTLGALRTITNILANTQVVFPLAVQMAGGSLLGVAAGYLTMGFLTCALQTLPWHERFMGYDADFDATNKMRKILPPDRVWLALMQRAGAYAFANQEDDRILPGDDTSLYNRYYTFDKSATFGFRYRQYRRYSDTRDVLPYNRDLDEELRGPR